MKTQVHATIDMGSATIKLVVGSVKEGRVNVYKKTLIRTSSKGFKNGEIINVKEIASNIKSAIFEMKKELKINIDHVAVSIPPTDLKIFRTEGIAIVDCENKIIDQRTFNKASKSCSDSIDDIYYKVVSKKIVECFIDGNLVEQKSIVGAQGTDLQLVTNVYTIPEALFMKYKETLRLANLKISAISISPLAISSELALSNSGNSIIIDIGHHKTTVSAFHEGQLFETATIPMAGKHITHDIFTLMNLSGYGQASTFKHKYSKLAVKDNTIIHFDDYGKNYTITDLNKITTRRVVKIFGEIKSFSEKIFDNQDKIDYVITGGSAKLFNIDKLSAKILKNTTRVYSPTTIGANSPDMTAVIGMLYSVHLTSKHKIMEGSTMPSIDISNWFKIAPLSIFKKSWTLLKFSKKVEVK